VGRDWQSIGAVPHSFVIIPFLDGHHPFSQSLCISESTPTPPYAPRGQNLHHFKPSKQVTQREVHDSRIIEMAKWGEFISTALDNRNIVVISWCGCELCKVKIQVYLLSFSLMFIV
jgi:hypothetical protein